jgi:hypothetical protein
MITEQERGGVGKASRLWRQANQGRSAEVEKGESMWQHHVFSAFRTVPVRWPSGPRYHQAERTMRSSRFELQKEIGRLGKLAQVAKEWRDASDRSAVIYHAFFSEHERRAGGFPPGSLFR